MFMTKRTVAQIRLMASAATASAVEALPSRPLNLLNAQDVGRAFTINRKYSTMVVRLATLADAEAIARVHVLTWQTAYRGLVPDDFLDALAIDRRTETWRNMLGDARPGEPVWVGLANYRRL